MTAEASHTGHYLYVSWGGSGRASCLRQALRQAEDADASLRYLAILDDGAFAGIDAGMKSVIADELAWLLETQIDLARRQTSIDRTVWLQVEAGDVGPLAAAVAKATDATKILIGAPVPVSATESVAELLESLRTTTGIPVDLILP